jgi:hypothetical protein
MNETLARTKGRPERAAPDIDKLENFLAERGKPLLSTAKLLTGSQDAAKTCCRRRWSDCSSTGARSTVTPKVICAGRCTTWPTRANLATAFNVPIPAGFKQVPPPQR